MIVCEILDEKKTEVKVTFEMKNETIYSTGDDPLIRN